MCKKIDKVNHEIVQKECEKTLNDYLDYRNGLLKEEHIDEKFLDFFKRLDNDLRK